MRTVRDHGSSNRSQPADPDIGRNENTLAFVVVAMWLNGKNRAGPVPMNGAWRTDRLPKKRRAGVSMLAGFRLSHLSGGIVILNRRPRGNQDFHSVL